MQIRIRIERLKKYPRHVSFLGYVSQKKNFVNHSIINIINKGQLCNQHFIILEMTYMVIEIEAH